MVLLDHVITMCETHVSVVADVCTSVAECVCQEIIKHSRGICEKYVSVVADVCTSVAECVCQELIKHSRTPGFAKKEAELKNVEKKFDGREQGRTGHLD